MSADTHRVALVTGGMGGLGEAICLKLAALGYTVVTTYSPGNTKADEWLAAMKAQGYVFHAYPCDVAELQVLVACVKKVTDDVRGRRAGEQRGDHARHDVQEDGQGQLGRRDEDEPRFVLQMTKQVCDVMAGERLGAASSTSRRSTDRRACSAQRLLGRQGRHARLHQGARARICAQGGDR